MLQSIKASRFNFQQPNGHHCPLARSLLLTWPVSLASLSSRGTMCGEHFVEAPSTPVSPKHSPLHTVLVAHWWLSTEFGLVQLVPSLCPLVWQLMLCLCVDRELSWGQSSLCSTFLKRKSFSSMLCTAGLPCLFPQVGMLPVNPHFWVYLGEALIQGMYKFRNEHQLSSSSSILKKNNFGLGRCLVKCLLRKCKDLSSDP